MSGCCASTAAGWAAAASAAACCSSSRAANTRRTVVSMVDTHGGFSFFGAVWPKKTREDTRIPLRIVRTHGESKCARALIGAAEAVDKAGSSQRSSDGLMGLSRLTALSPDVPDGPTDAFLCLLLYMGQHECA